MVIWPVDTMLKACYRMFGLPLVRLYSTVTKTPKRPFTVAIEGNIGSGKTSLLQHFAKCDNVEVIQEPVHKWRDVAGSGENAFAKMYEDPSRWALTFQTYVQLTMLETHVAPTEKPVKLMERSIYSAKYCFVENLKRRNVMPDIEYIILTRWFDWIVKNEDCNLDLIVYLRTKPETVYERIKKRCRKEENRISMDYLETLHDLHEDWLIKKLYPVPCPVLVIDSDKDLDRMTEIYDENQKLILGVKN